MAIPSHVLIHLIQNIKENYIIGQLQQFSY